MDELNTVKVIVLILLALIKLGSGLLPVLLDKVLQVKKVKWLEKFMSGMLCVGGGVLLSTVFVHMIPEVRESFELAQKDNCLTTNDTDSPSKLSPCLSPWVFEGKLHKSCIKTKDGRRTYWCPTELNIDGQFISGSSDWGYCDLRKCKLPDDHAHHHEHHDHGYPMAELVLCLGFFIIYLIEALVHRIFGLEHGHSHQLPAQNTNKNLKTEVENGVDNMAFNDTNNDGPHSHQLPAQNTTNKNSKTEVENGVDNMAFNDTNNDGPISSPPDSPNTTANSKTVCSPMTSEDNHPDNSTNNLQFKYRCSPVKGIGSRNVYNISSATLTSYTSYSDGDSLDASLPNHMGLPVVKQKHNRKSSTTTIGNLAREKNILTSIRNFLIVLALSIHSVFEGMVIGLQTWHVKRIF